MMLFVHLASPRRFILVSAALIAAIAMGAILG
jgi:hypothetical protein